MASRQNAMRYHPKALIQLPFFGKEHFTSLFYIENALIVSDLHYGSKETYRPVQVVKYAKDYGIHALVIAGDLFEYEHKFMSINDLFKKVYEVLEILGFTFFKRIFITFSRSSHDPIVYGDISWRNGESEIYVTSKILRLKSGSMIFNVTHGDIICSNGFLAYLINRMAEKIGQKLLLEKLLKRKLRIPHSHWLIMGHTHIPGISYTDRVANAGSWKSYWRTWASKTAIFIDKREVRLITFR